MADVALTASLTPEQQEAVRRLIEAGIFASEEEAVARSHEWLRYEAERLEKLREGIGRAAGERARGEMIDGEEVFAELKRRHEEEFGPTGWST